MRGFAALIGVASIECGPVTWALDRVVSIGELEGFLILMYLGYRSYY